MKKKNHSLYNYSYPHHLPWSTRGIWCVAKGDLVKLKDKTYVVENVKYTSTPNIPPIIQIKPLPPETES